MKRKLALHTRLKLGITGVEHRAMLLKQGLNQTWKSLQQPRSIRVLVRTNLNIGALTAVTLLKNHAKNHVGLGTALTISDPLGLLSGGLQLLGQTKGYNRYIRTDRIVQAIDAKKPGFARQNDRKVYINNTAERLALVERSLRFAPIETAYVSIREKLNVEYHLSAHTNFNIGAVELAVFMGTVSQGFYEAALSNYCEAQIQAADEDQEAINKAISRKEGGFVLGSVVSVAAMGLTLIHPILGGTGFAGLLAMGIFVQSHIKSAPSVSQEREYKPLFLIKGATVASEGELAMSSDQSSLPSWQNVQAENAEEVTVMVQKNQ